MAPGAKSRSLIDGPVLRRAVVDSFRKQHPAWFEAEAPR